MAIRIGLLCSSESTWQKCRARFRLTSASLINPVVAAHSCSDTRVLLYPDILAVRM